MDGQRTDIDLRLRHTGCVLRAQGFMDRDKDLGRPSGTWRRSQRFGQGFILCVTSLCVTSLQLSNSRFCCGGQSCHNSKLGLLTPSRSFNTLVTSFLGGQCRAWGFGVCTTMTHRLSHSRSLSLNTCCPSRTTPRG